MAGITRTLVAALAMFVAISTSPRAQADPAVTWTAIALAESGGTLTRSVPRRASRPTPRQRSSRSGSWTKRCRSRSDSHLGFDRRH